MLRDFVPANDRSGSKPGHGQFCLLVRFASVPNDAPEPTQPARALGAVGARIDAVIIRT